MTRSPHRLDDRDLAAALRDLGDHLDPGPGATDEGRAALTSALLDRLDGLDVPGEGSSQRSRRRRSRGPRRSLVAAAVVVAVGAATLAIAPAREAIADWFGVDGLRLTRTDGNDGPPAGPDPARPGLPIGDERPDLAELATRLPFELRLPAEPGVGPALAARIDPDVPTGLIEVRYQDFSFVALASRPGGPPVLAKDVGPATTVEAVTVGDQPGLWLTGAPHQLSFLDPDGDVLVDSVRRAGDVLLWQSDGVTYRIEGHSSLAAAQEVARTVR